MSTNTAAQPIVIPPPTAEEEGLLVIAFSLFISNTTTIPDQIILARISLDERPLRRMIKRFHSYTSLSHSPIVPALHGNTAAPTSIDDAREGFLIELATFELLMKKSVMICEAEARQVEEYQRERQLLGMFNLGIPAVLQMLIVLKTTSTRH